MDKKRYEANCNAAKDALRRWVKSNGKDTQAQDDYNHAVAAIHRQWAAERARRVRLALQLVDSFRRG